MNFEMERPVVRDMRLTGIRAGPCSLGRAFPAAEGLNVAESHGLADAGRQRAAWVIEEGSGIVPATQGCERRASL
jgi:hypothetical protein